MYKKNLLGLQYGDNYFSQNKNIKYDMFKYAKFYHTVSECSFCSAKSLSTMGQRREFKQDLKDQLNLEKHNTWLCTEMKAKYTELKQSCVCGERDTG